MKETNVPDDVGGRLRNAVADRFRELQANAPNWTFNYWGMADHALDFIPDGWAKWNGQWVQVFQADRWDVESGRTVLVTADTAEDD